MPEVGVLVMAYGTPSSPEQIEQYYTHIRRGRPPSPEQLADLTRRYEALGGVSTLAERTAAQIQRLQDALGERFSCTLGQKHAAPFVEDGVGALAGLGLTAAVGLVLAPHFSGASVGEYHERAGVAAAERGLAYGRIDSWHLEPAYLDFLAAAVVEAQATMPARHKVLFTAHSLPERLLAGDPYPDQLEASAAAVAERAGLARWSGWSVAWQSAGATPEPWRGPDVLEVIADLGATGRTDGVVVCPQGFVADHLEVAYDLDIEAAAAAERAGLAFARTRVLDDDPTVFAALARLVTEQARALDGGRRR